MLPVFFQVRGYSNNLRYKLPTTLQLMPAVYVNDHQISVTYVTFWTVFAWWKPAWRSGLSYLFLAEPQYCRRIATFGITVSEKHKERKKYRHLYWCVFLFAFFAFFADKLCFIENTSKASCAFIALFAIHYFFFGRFQPLMVFCDVLLKVSSPSSVSLVMVLPAPIVEFFPIVTGAISCVSEPINAPSLMIVLCLLAPS